MSSKWSAGPWHTRQAIKPDNVGGYDVAIIDVDNMIIAEVFEIVDHETKRPADANARLIAAAPLMLEALSVLLAHAEECFPRTKDKLSGIDAARAALAAARGEEPKR